MNINQVKIDDLVCVTSWNIYATALVKYQKARVIKILKNSIRVQVIDSDKTYNFKYSSSYGYYLKDSKNTLLNCSLIFDIERVEQQIKQTRLNDKLKSFRDYANMQLNIKIEELRKVIKGASIDELKILVDKIINVNN